MLVLGLLLLTYFTAIAGLGGVQQSTARIASIPTMSPAPVSCDIEDVPAGLVESYKRHTTATYHAFTAEEVSRYPLPAAARPGVAYIVSLSLSCSRISNFCNSPAALAYKFEKKLLLYIQNVGRLCPTHEAVPGGGL